MKKYLPLLITILLMQQNIVAQRLPLLSQIHYAQHLFNPAYVVLKPKAEVYYMNRSLWLNIPGSPTTNTITFIVPLKKDIASLGGYFTTDRISITKNSSGRLDFSYKVKEIDSVKIYLGLGGGFTTVNYHYIPSVGVVMNYSRYNAIAGVLMNWKELNIGISIPQLFTNTLTLKLPYTKNPDNNYRNIPHIIGTLDYNINLNNYFNVKTIYTIQKGGKGMPYQFGLNAILRYKNNYWASIGMRTKGNITAGMGMLLLKRFTFGYGYDLLQTQLNLFGVDVLYGNNHEVIFGYQFGKKSK